jgi:hypothetical protein
MQPGRSGAGRIKISRPHPPKFVVIKLLHLDEKGNERRPPTWVVATNTRPAVIVSDELDTPEKAYEICDSKNNAQPSP